MLVVLNTTSFKYNLISLPGGQVRIQMHDEFAKIQPGLVRA